MANRWCDGFGRYGSDESKMLNGSSSQAWAEVANSFSFSTANPRTGSRALRLGGGTGAAICRRVFGAALEEVYVGFAINVASLPTTETAGTTGGGLGGFILGEFKDQSNARHLRLMLGTDGGIELRRDYTVLARTAPIIGAGAYQHIEIYARASTENGAVEVRVDEVAKINLTGINTVATSNVEFSQFAFGRELNCFGPSSTDYADFFCNDTVDDGSGCNTFIGDCKSGTLMVDSDTAQADFALSAGSVGYELIDEVPPSDSDYIEEADTTGQSNFGFADTPANLTEILTARPFDRAQKDDAGTATIAPTLISNGSKHVVASQPISTAFAYYDANVPFDPDTGAPWTKAGLDAALRAVERTA